MRLCFIHFLCQFALLFLFHLRTPQTFKALRSAINVGTAEILSQVLWSIHTHCHVLICGHHYLQNCFRKSTLEPLLFLCILLIMLLLSFADSFPKNSFWNFVRVSNGLDSDQDRQNVSPDLGNVGPDLGPNYKGYQQMTEVVTSKERLDFSLKTFVKLLIG